MQHAVEVIGLTKEFTRRKGRTRTRVRALDGVSFSLAPRRVRRRARPERLGQVDARPRALDAAALRRRQRARVRPRRRARRARRAPARQPRLGRGVVLQADVGDARTSPTRRASTASARAQTRARGSRRSSARVGFPVERAGAPMEDLSRGMQQKVALARALLTSPTLLLLDEPTTGLDPRSKREVQDFIREVRARRTTRRRCCARTTWPRPRRSPTASGSSHRGRLLALEEPARAAPPLRRGDARGRVLRRDRPRARGRTEDDDEEAA